MILVASVWFRYGFKHEGQSGKCFGISHSAERKKMKLSQIIYTAVDDVPLTDRCPVLLALPR